MANRGVIFGGLGGSNQGQTYYVPASTSVQALFPPVSGVVYPTRVMPAAPAAPTVAADFSVDFTTTSSLPSQMTLSRASNGTYFNSSGALSTATSNVARFDFDPWSLSPKGLLVEDQRTNTNTTNDFSNAAWTGANRTVSAAVAGLDGTSNAYNVVPTVTSGAHSIENGASKTASGTLPVVYSIYAKSTGYTQVIFRETGSALGAPAVCINIDGSGIVSYENGYAPACLMSNAMAVPVGGGWYRCSVMCSTNAASQFQALIMIADGGLTLTNVIDPLSNYNWSGDGTKGITFAYPQTEIVASTTNYIPSSYIYTTGTAATRSADIVSSTDAAWLGYKGWVFETIDLDPSIAATILGINTVIGVGYSSTNAATTTDGGTQTTTTIAAPERRNRVAIGWDSTPRVSITMNGDSFTSAANTPVTPTSLYFGSTNAGASGFLNGCIMMFGGYAALADADLPSVSVVGATFSPPALNVGAASGSGTAAGIGAATAASTGSAAGNGAATAVGASTAASTGAAAGNGVATAVGRSTAASTGSAAGTGVASAVGVGIAIATGSAAGSGTAIGIGLSSAASVGSAAGSGTAAATAGLTGSAAGTGAASAVGASIAAAIGSAAGSGAASTVGRSTAAAIGSSSGSGTATAVGTSTAAAIGSSAASGTASAVGASTAVATGSAAGSGTAIAVGASTAKAVGSSSGAGTATAAGATGNIGLASGSGIATGIGRSTAAAVGTAAGSASVSGVGSSGSTATAVGTASGSATVAGAGASTAASVGSSAGSGSAAGVGSSFAPSVVTAVGTASGSSNVIGIGQAVQARPRIWHVANNRPVEQLAGGDFSNDFSADFNIGDILTPPTVWKPVNATPRFASQWKVANNKPIEQLGGGDFSNDFSDDFNIGDVLTPPTVWKSVNATPKFASQWKVANNKPIEQLGGGDFSNDFSDDFNIGDVLDPPTKWKRAA